MPQLKTTDAHLSHSDPPFEDGYQAVFDRNPTPMWVFDLDTHRFLAVNAAATAEYGYPPDTFLTLTVRDVYEDSERLRLDRALAGDAQDLYAGLWTHCRQNGSLLQVDIRSNDLRFHGQRARLIHATNVTARIQAEAARRESEQLLGTIVESSDDAILSKAVDGTILTWNAAAERLYGYTAVEAIGTSVELLVPLECRAELAASLSRVHGGARIAPYETTRVCKDGRRISVSVGISPIVDKAGDVVGIASIARDITQRKGMEDQLRQSQRLEAMGSLAGGIAHDFNNLWTVIACNAELALEQIDPAGEARADIDEIRIAAQSATLLTRQLLTFSRQGIVQDAVIDLNEVVAHLDRLLRRTLGEDVEFIVRGATTLGSVRADFGQLEQVLMNLVINARDAMPEGGTLIVETHNVSLDESFVAANPAARVGAFVKLAVSDTGSGMTPEVRARVFDPFFTTKSATKGTGLGLSTAFEIVKEAGGFFEVMSSPGAGSSFAAYFPQIAGEVAPKASSAVLPVGAGTETILLVEDDNNIRTLGARGLRRHGYTVVVARHAVDALKVVKQHGGHIHLLLTDIVMPGSNGRVLAEELMKSVSGLRVLYTSGYTDSTVTLQHIRASSASFLQKPYTPDTLARKVREVLDAPYGRRRLG